MLRLVGREDTVGRVEDGGGMTSETKVPSRPRLPILGDRDKSAYQAESMSPHPGYRQHGCTLATTAVMAAPVVIAFGHGPDLAYPPRSGIQAVWTARGRASRRSRGSVGPIKTFGSAREVSAVGTWKRAQSGVGLSTPLWR